jgi:hypothetical protein
MAILTDSDVANGSLVGTESLDGTSVDHYVIDGPTFLAAARASSHPAVQTFGQALRHAGDADVYIDTETGYPQRYRGTFSGNHPIGLDGDFSVRLDLTNVGTDRTVILPEVCAKPISR